MSYPNSLYSAVVGYTVQDITQLQVEGMRRNSMVVFICSLLALASVSVYGPLPSVIIPVCIISSVSLFISLKLTEEYLAFSQRALVALVFSTIVYLSLISQSLSTVVLFVPVLTFVYFTERKSSLRLRYVFISFVALGITVSRFWPNVGMAGFPLEALRLEAFTDCILATVFTGAFIRSHSVFSRITIEVAKAQSLRLRGSIRRTEDAIAELEARRTHLRTIREKTSSALDNERVAARQIRASHEQLEQFAYAASHDLKEPIRTVRSFFQVIRRRIDPDVLAKADVAELVGHVEKTSSSMHSMLERLLLYSRLSSKEGKTRSVELTALINDVVDREKVDVQIEIEQGAEAVKMDVDCMKQLTQELISNAIAFASPEQPLELKFEAKNGRPGYVSCAVSDNGIGIAKTDLARAVGMFQRLDVTNEASGSGLGLCIAKTIVNRAGGEFQLESDGSSGTVVRFELPAIV